MNQQFFQFFNSEARKVMEKTLKKNHKFECYCCKNVWPSKGKVKVAPGVFFDEWCYQDLVTKGI